MTLRFTPMTWIRRAATTILMLFGAILLGTTALHAQAPDLIWLRISHVLATGDSVQTFATSPDGRFAVYISGGVRNRFDDLYSVPVAGGAPIRLSPPLTGLRQVLEFRISPNSQRVVYIADQDTAGVYELYSVPIGGGTVTKLSGAMVGVGVQPTLITNNAPGIFKFTSDSQRVVFVADQDNAGRNELYSVPVDGSAPPTRLSNVVAGGSMLASGDSFALTADDSRVIYIADQNQVGIYELFSVPTGGATAAFRLSSPMAAGADVIQFDISPNGGRVIYVADQNGGDIFELFSVPANGGIAIKLSPSLSSSSDVLSAEIMPDSHTVLFRISESSTVASLWKASIDDSNSATRLSLQSDYALSPDETFIVYIVPRGSEGDIRRLTLANGIDSFVTPVFGFASGLQVSPDNQTIVYLASPNNNAPRRNELFSVPSNGAGSRINLSRSLGNPDFYVLSFEFRKNGAEVFFNKLVSGCCAKVFVTKIDGSSSPVEVNTTEAAVTAGLRSPDGERVLYLSDQVTSSVVELFSAFDKPLVHFSSTGYFVTEEGTDLITLERTGIVDAPGNVRVAFTDETATGGATLGGGIDYVNNALSLAFAAGQITATVPMILNNDGITETAETLRIQLFEPDRVGLGTPSEAQVTIRDAGQTPLILDLDAQIAENSPVDSLVGRVPVVQAGRTLSYTIASGNENGAFAIDSGGRILVANNSTLDHETLPQVVLTVRAEDTLGQSDLATVTIAVLDVNEAPTALGYTGSVREDAAPGVRLGTILVQDQDVGDSLSFSLSHPLFSVEPTGAIVVRNALDFETQATHTLNVVVADRAGLQATATVVVQLIDVVEPAPAAIRLNAISPGYTFAGRSSFWLRVYGENFSRTSRVRFAGTTLSTYFSHAGLIYGYVPSTLVRNSGNKIVDVMDGTAQSVNNRIFPVYFLFIGESSLGYETPGDVARSIVGETTTFVITWTHTSLVWREMNLMDLRMQDEERTPLWIRYTEAFTNGADASMVSLLNSDGSVAGTGRFGENKTLENDTVLIDLYAASFQGSGPTGSTVSVRIPVVFKKAAVGPFYNLELFGVDDQGGEQGPDTAGTWEISEPRIYLPVVQSK